MEQSSIWMKQPERPVARPVTKKMEASRTIDAWANARLQRDLEAVILRPVLRMADDGTIPKETGKRIHDKAEELWRVIDEEYRRLNA